MSEQCEHEYKHMETVKVVGQRPSIGIDYGRQWKRVDRFYCSKCLETKEKIQTAEGWEERPKWFESEGEYIASNQESEKIL